MKAQPSILNDWKAKLWCRFFLLSVFATMYLNDLQRSDFYASLGLDAREYDIHVIKRLMKPRSGFPGNESGCRVASHPEFFLRGKNAWRSWAL
jgi:hypothetical protein